MAGISFSLTHTLSRMLFRGKKKKKDQSNEFIGNVSCSLWISADCKLGLPCRRFFISLFFYVCASSESRWRRLGEYVVGMHFADIYGRLEDVEMREI